MCAGRDPPGEAESTRGALHQLVLEQRPLRGFPFGRLQATEDRLGRLEAIPAQVLLHRLELGDDLRRVPRAGGRLLPRLRLAPDEDQSVVEPDCFPIDLALEVLGHRDCLITVAFFG
jgi:hypothetical protein